MSAADCKFCERDCCDTDCSFADRHRDEPRKTAAEWRAEGAAAMRAAVQSLRAELGPGGDPEVDRDWLVARLDAILGPQPAAPAPEPPEPETIEVPVTRRARCTLVGTLDLNCRAGVVWCGAERLKPGDEVACRGVGHWWRTGTTRVMPNGDVDFRRIVAACTGDAVYRVEQP